MTIAPSHVSTTMTEAVVDLGAIAHNVRTLRAAMGAGALMAVVKADGFGHGAVPVARTALANGATVLGVAAPCEAVELRHAGIAAPMMCWLPGDVDEYVELASCAVDVSVSSLEQLRHAATAARVARRPMSIHLKVDTGLHRGGAPAALWRALVEGAARWEALGRIRVRGVWSHFANSEDGPGDPIVTAQLTAFARALVQVHEVGLRPPLRHLANSAAILGLPDSRLDLGRAGAAVYGIETIPGRSHGLRGALTLRTRVAQVDRVPAGIPRSVDDARPASCATTVAQLPVGFADGLKRCLGGRADVLVRGVRCPVVGRIGMNHCVVDVGDLPVCVGEPVVVLGPGDDGEPTVAELAHLAGTIPHEILTGLGPHIPRRYLPQEHGP